jgi:DNA-binding GntR family transcriptional regulator
MSTTPKPVASRRTPRRERGDGLSRQVTVALRQAIVTGALQPGERLTEDGIAEEHGVSRIPVREAFRALEVEGFVTIEPFSGTFVSRLSDRDAADLLEVRQAIEVLAISRAATRRTEAQIHELDGILGAADAAFATGSTTDLVSLNGRFHLVLAEASGNATIVNLLDQLRHKVEWVYAAELDARARDSWAEHHRIVDSLRAADPLRASALMQAHITNAEAAYHRRAAPGA